MPTNVWSGGVGETVGDAYLTATSCMSSGELYYVLFSTGDDANDGRDRAKPKKTLASAIAAAAAVATASTIVLLPGHDEVITAAIVLADASAGLMILGSGKVGGKPAAKLRQSTGIATAMITVSTAGVVFGNIYFGENVVDLATPKVNLSVSATLADGRAIFRDCLFEMGDHDLGPAVRISTDHHFGRIENCAFNAVATALPLQPLCAIQLNAAAQAEGWEIRDTVFDGGVTGYSNFWAFDSSGGSGLLRFLFERISLLRGADMRFASGDLGHLSVTTGQLGARIRW